MKRTSIAVFAAGLCIGVCEFLRNELVFRDFWVDTFTDLWLVFASEPVNNAPWAIWTLPLAGSNPCRVTGPGRSDGQL